MTRTQLSASAAVSLVALGILIVVLWHYIALAIVGWIAWKVLARQLGFKPRPKSRWSSLIQSGAVAYAAWNSRWLKPTTRASIPAKAGREHAPDEAPTLHDTV